MNKTIFLRNVRQSLLFFGIVCLPVIIAAGVWFAESFSPRDVQLLVEVPYEHMFPGEERYIEKNIELPSDSYLVSFVSSMSGFGRVLHHADLLYPDFEYSYCGKGMSAPIYSTGEELNVLDLSATSYGIFVSRDKKLHLSLHLTNPGNRIESGVFSITITGKKHRNPVTPVFLSISDYCLGGAGEVATEYTIPTSSSRHEAVMERPFRVPHQAAIVAWGGHLHNYGTSLSLIVDEVEISRLRGTTDKNSPGDPPILPGVFFPVPVEVSEGSALDLHAVYDKPPGMEYSGAMGIGFLIMDFSF